MFIWMTGLLNVSRMWFTENQRRCFFEKVDALYEENCVRLVREMLPPDQSRETEQKIRAGMDIDDWWDAGISPGHDSRWFESERVYPAMFDDLEENGYYWEEVCRNAPAEKMEDWYRCSAVKSLLHEFVNDEADPYKLTDQLSDKEIACFSYMICSVYVRYMKQHLHVDDEDAGRMLSLLYCGEFAQNEWLNLVNGESVREIRPRVTERFLNRFLFNHYSMGMDPVLFREFLHEEVLSPVYIAVYDARHEMLSAGREYLALHEDNPWTPGEMESFNAFVLERVDLDLGEPDFDAYR